MFSRFQLVFKYICYYLTASSGRGHGTHSPFIFQFITQVLNDRQHYDAYEKAERLRQRLLQDTTIIKVDDYGAGSSVDKSNRRSISSIEGNAVKSKKYGQLLYRMVKYYQPATILELGTSLGITTSYLAIANPNAKLITIEGAKEIASVAKQNFKTSELHNVELVEGNFNHTLSPVVCGLSSIDFAFIDGNHRQEPTERYFQQLLLKINDNTIFVIDDIHRSREMEEAWEVIQQHPSVRCSVDLFFIGIIFFRTVFREKQHFKIRF